MTLEKQYAAAVERLPQMSVIVIPETEQDDEERATFVPIEPGDPFIEALRTAREIGAQLDFLDTQNIRSGSHVQGLYADPYVARA